jgi:glyoxylase-like metal-dependent hydrolase (beta-lactamase superfamily II)
MALLAPLVPDTALIRETIPQADDVLVGHAHYDHILDAPDLCKQTGARLIGSSSTIMVGRAAGLPEEQLRVTEGHEDIPSGPWTVPGCPPGMARSSVVFRFPATSSRHPPGLPAWPISSTDGC